MDDRSFLDLNWCTAHDEECDPCKTRWSLFLGLNLETAAALTAVAYINVQKGWTNRDVLARFGESADDVANEPDYRPVPLG